MNERVAEPDRAIAQKMWEAVRADMRTHSTSDILNWDYLSKEQLIDAIMEGFSQTDIDQYLGALGPDERKALLRAHGLWINDKDEIEPVRLCGGASTPEEERAAYERALRGEA